MVQSLGIKNVSYWRILCPNYFIKHYSQNSANYQFRLNLLLLEYTLYFHPLKIHHKNYVWATWDLYVRHNFPERTF